MIYAILGPTCSGKSDLAEAISLKKNCPVINFDAFQVYKEINKGTAKPEGFAENLAKTRKGSNNPNAKGLEHPIYIVDCNTQKRLKGFFAYSYQIDDFLCKKNAWSNVKKAINHINMRNGSQHRYQVCYGYYWLTWDCAKDYPLE